LDDLESDFSAIHRIDDMLAMPAPKFFRLALRLPAYRGVMRAIVENDLRQEQERLNAAGIRSQPVPLTPEMARAGFGGSAFDA